MGAGSLPTPGPERAPPPPRRALRTWNPFLLPRTAGRPLATSRCPRRAVPLPGARGRAPWHSSKGRGLTGRPPMTGGPSGASPSSWPIRAPRRTTTSSSRPRRLMGRPVWSLRVAPRLRREAWRCERPGRFQSRPSGSLRVAPRLRWVAAVRRVGKPRPLRPRESGRPRRGHGRVRGVACRGAEARASRRTRPTPHQLSRTPSAACPGRRTPARGSRGARVPPAPVPRRSFRRRSRAT